MKTIIKRMEDTTGQFEDFFEMAQEEIAEIAVEDDAVVVLCKGVMLHIPREIFTGIGL